jgi:hypothetical protein
MKAPELEPFCTKKVYIRICRLSITSWQEWADTVRTRYV